MEDRVVALSIAQQAAYAALERQLAEHNVAVLSARAGMGKTRILRALHTVTGGLYLTSREFVEASAHAHPLSLDETIYAVLRQSLEAHDTVIVDDFQFVSLVACCVHAYPRQNFLGAALLPLAAMAQSDSKKLVFAAILRSGMGMLDGMLELVPAARVGHIGLYRDPATLNCVEYYFKFPADLGERTVIVIDPMLATGNTAIAAVDRLKEAGAKDIRMACLLCSPEGLSKFQGHHPGVHVWTASIDERLNDHGYILPGLGDAGDRMYGTR